MFTLFNGSVLPPDSAAIVARAVNRAVAVGDVSRIARWQIVEFWAADYLNAQHQLRAHQQGKPVDERVVVSAVSPAMALDRMTQAFTEDQENGHILADKLMVEILRSLGYERAMDVYDGQTKWYS